MHWASMPAYKRSYRAAHQSFLLSIDSLHVQCTKYIAMIWSCSIPDLNGTKLYRERQLIPWNETTCSIMQSLQCGRAPCHIEPTEAVFSALLLLLHAVQCNAENCHAMLCYVCKPQQARYLRQGQCDGSHGVTMSKMCSAALTCRAQVPLMLY